MAICCRSSATARSPRRHSVLTFAALARIGASHTAVVMTLEAASTVVLAAIVLGEGISPAQALGGLAILAARRLSHAHTARASA